MLNEKCFFHKEGACVLLFAAGYGWAGMEHIPVMWGSLSPFAGIADNNGHNLIMIEELADEGVDQPLLKAPFNGRIILAE